MQYLFNIESLIMLLIVLALGVGIWKSMGLGEFSSLWFFLIFQNVAYFVIVTYFR